MARHVQESQRVAEEKQCDNWMSWDQSAEEKVDIFSTWKVCVGCEESEQF